MLWKDQNLIVCWKQIKGKTVLKVTHPSFVPVYGTVGDEVKSSKFAVLNEIARNSLAEMLD